MALFCLLALNGSAQKTIVTWRGPAADGIYNETNLLKVWPENGPQLVWSDTTAGIGYTTPVLVNNKLYCAGMIGNTGYLMWYNMDGKKLWQKPYGTVITSYSMHYTKLYAVSRCVKTRAVTSSRAW